MPARTPVVVIFRSPIVPSVRGEVVAVFPEVPGTGEPWTCTIYTNAEQHGTADLDWIRKCTDPATPGPALDALRAELAGIGYDLLERRRVSPKMRAALRAAHRRPVVAS